MTLLLFLLVLVALIVVHEFGHFVVAKLSGMRVDEFGIGYPPRACVFARKGDTEYTLNWLPFGGFVRIYGEDPDTTTSTDASVGYATGEEESGALDKHRAFGARPRILQALTLVAGIFMNLLFAYVLITATLIAGTTRSLEEGDVARATDVHVSVADLVKDGPASTAGIRVGDQILSARYGKETFSGTKPFEFSTFVASNTTLEPIEIDVLRDGTPLTISAKPSLGLVTSEPTRPALGIAIATAGVLKVGFVEALSDGAVITWNVTTATAVGLSHFFASIFTFSANLADVSGPVGIAGAVGDAGANGIVALLTITAIISVNLALINILPFPALDGGRLLFVIIESITRRPIPASVGMAVNGIGFAFLILLMVVVTAHDLFKIFS